MKIPYGQENDLLLRSQEVHDEDFVFSLFVSSREREFLPISSFDREPFARQQYDLYQSGIRNRFPDAERYIIHHSADFSGTTETPCGIFIYQDEPLSLRIVDLAITPDYRNKGIGTAILRTCMNICSKAKKTMVGSATPYNPARKLYSRLGIKESNSNTGYITLTWTPTNT